MSATAIPKESMPFDAVICSAGRGINALHIIRALGRVGLKVALVRRDDGDNLCASSRYCSGEVFISDSGLHVTLSRIAQQQTVKPVIFFDNDAMLWAISPYGDEVERLFLVTSPLRRMAQLLDKRYQIDSSTRAGIPTPETWWPETWDDYKQVGRRARGTLVLKPSPKEFRGLAPFKIRSGIDGEGFLSGLDLERASPNQFFLQEEIKGGDENVWFALCYRREGGEFMGVSGFKIRQSGGGSGGIMAMGRTCHNSEVLRLARIFLSEIGYCGICGVEFKFDPISGKYFFIEISARTERFHGVALKAGVNFPLTAFRDLVGLQPPLAKDYRSVTWFDFGSTLRSCRRRWSFRAFKEVLRSVGCPVQSALFAIDDLMPLRRSWMRASLMR